MFKKKVHTFFPWSKSRSHSDIAGENSDSDQEIELNAKGGTDGCIVKFDESGDIVQGDYPKQYSSTTDQKCPIEGFPSLAHLCSVDYGDYEDISKQIFESILRENNFELENLLVDYDVERLNNLKLVGRPILHLICIKCNTDLLDTVLQYQIKIEQLDNEGVTALHLAVALQWAEGVERLLLEGANPNVTPGFLQVNRWHRNDYPIHTACRNGDLTVTKLLIDFNANLICLNSDEDTPFHLAALSHNVELLRKLLEDKTTMKQVSSSNKYGNAPLHMLMLGKDLMMDEDDIVECVKIILRKGANIDASNSKGLSVLFLAAKENLPLVVKTLIESNASQFIKGLDRRNVLHAACKGDSPEALTYLLQNPKAKKLVLETDLKGHSPFHSAVRSCSISCCEILLQNGDHLAIVDHSNRTRCSLVLRNMPSGLKLLKNIFDKNVILSDHDTDDPDFNIKMDFNVLLAKTTEDVEASLIADFTSSKAEPLLNHPLIESFLYLKWKKIKPFYFAYVFTYFLFLMIHSFYVIETYNMKRNWETNIILLNTIHWMHATLLVILIMQGSLMITVNLRKYIKQWETYFKVTALSTAGFVVFSSGSNFSPEILRIMASISIFFAWIEFMMLLGRFPSLGVYILMFTKVSKSVLKFLLAFTPLFIAFALTFSILLIKDSTFGTFPTIFVRTLMMMLGEIDFGTIYEGIHLEGKPIEIISLIFLVVFVILIPILLTNLLIGLAVSDLSDLQLQGKIRRLVKEASYLESYEKLMLLFKKLARVPNMVPRALSGQGAINRVITIYPNQRNNKLSVEIPKEAIEEAMISGTKENDQEKEDFEFFFKDFIRDYMRDQENIRNALQNIYCVLNKEETKKSSEDLTPGKHRRRKMTPLIKSKYLKEILFQKASFF